MKTKRVGSLTLGITLVLFGVLFLLRLFIDSLDYITVMKFWPVSLIMLGIELLVASATHKDEGVKLDAFSIIMTFVIIVFTMCVASAEFVVTNLPEHINL